MCPGGATCLSTVCCFSKIPTKHILHVLQSWPHHHHLIENKIWYDLKDHNMATKQWISIRNIIIYLETKFCPNRRIFVFWRPFWIQNGRHSKPKWPPYGTTCLTPSKYLFPLKSFHFWIFNNLFLFSLFLYWRPFWKF